eukprot:m51a1_g12102 hypothetical protein (83) ;mRNA; f:700-2483
MAAAAAAAVPAVEPELSSEPQQQQDTEPEKANEQTMKQDKKTEQQDGLLVPAQQQDQIIKGLEAARAKLKEKIAMYKKEQVG